MILAYGDDSADEREQRYSSVGIVLAEDRSWGAIEHEWVRRCDGIPFHATDCEAGWGDFRTVDHGGTRTHDENRAHYRTLVELMVEDERVGGAGFGIDLAAQQRVFPNARPLAYFKLFLEAIERVRVYCARTGQIARFTFDISETREYNAGQLYDQAREFVAGAAGQMVAGLSFGRWRDCPRLQMADLMAYEAIKALANGMEGRGARASWRAMLATGRFHALSFGEDYFRSMKEELPRLEARLGVSMGAYPKWLEVGGRQHNLSNMIQYMNWAERQRLSRDSDDRA